MPSDSVPVPPTTATATLAPPSASDSGLLLEASSADRFEATLHRDAKFWDQVASRKQKAKKRKSRKFLSSQQERFSIADDLRMDDDSSATEVNFYSSFTTGSGGGGGGASTGGAGAGSGDAGKAYSNLSDLDLIMQLAELESGVSSEEFSFVQNNNNNNSTAAISSTSTSSSFSAVEAGTPSGSETSKGTSKSTSKAPASELQVLEELERELGLDNFLAGISTGDSSKAGAGGGGGGGGGSSAGVAEADASSKQSASSVAASLLSDDDNLDELEKYLQSLGSPAGKPK